MCAPLALDFFRHASILRKNNNNDDGDYRLASCSISVVVVVAVAVFASTMIRFNERTPPPLPFRSGPVHAIWCDDAANAPHGPVVCQ